MIMFSYEFDLTVATVCRNALDSLPRCIESVQPLYGKEIRVEHLLVDGCSDDGTVSYLHEQLEKGRISRFISEPDKGLYDAMNKAIKLAKGQIIVFINADDEICPGAVSVCCEPILAGRVEYTVASAAFVSEKHEKVMVPRMDDVLWSQPYCHQAMYCSVKLLSRMGGFRGDLFRIAADTDLMRRLYAQHIPYECVDVVSARFYDGGVSSSLCVHRDVYELTLYHSCLYFDVIRKREDSLPAVVKHICRVFSRVLNQMEAGIIKSELPRMREFLFKLRNCVPETVAGRLARQYRRKAMLCAFASLFRKRAKRQLCKCQVFVYSLVASSLRQA